MPVFPPIAAAAAATAVSIGLGLLVLAVATSSSSSLAPITRAVKADAAAVGRALLNLTQYHQEIDWRALRAAAAKDVAAFVNAVLLRRDWHVGLLPLAVGLCVAASSLSRLLGGGGQREAAAMPYDPREAAARTTVGELGPVGDCLVELAGLTTEMLRFSGDGGNKKKG